MKNTGNLTPREQLHMMVDMIDEAYLQEAKHNLGALVSKTLGDDRQPQRKKR